MPVLLAGAYRRYRGVGTTRCVEGRGRAAAMEGCSVVTIVATPLSRTPAQYSSKLSRAASATTASGKASYQKGSVALDPNVRRST